MADRQDDFGIRKQAPDEGKRQHRKWVFVNNPTAGIHRRPFGYFLEIAISTESNQLCTGSWESRIVLQQFAWSRKSRLFLKHLPTWDGPSTSYQAMSCRSA